MPGLVDVKVLAQRLLRRDEGPFKKFSLGSSVARGRAVHLDGTIKQSTGSRTQPFLGVSLEDGNPGQQRYMQTSGVLDVGVASLGAGVACAVGSDASGNLVRATDPACASAPNWLGDCDAAGTITVRPRNPKHLDVQDFGADPTGVASSQIAFEQAIASAGPGDTILVPRGVYLLTATLDLSQKIGLTLAGEGKTDTGGSLLRFNNDSGDGLRLSTQLATNTPVHHRVRDLHIQQTNNNNRTWAAEGGALGGAAIGILGSGIISVESVGTSGCWKYAIACDGGEECVFQDCIWCNSKTGGETNDDPSYGIWLADYSRGFTVPESTNVNQILRCHTNGPAFGFRLSGGCLSNSIRDCLVNLGQGYRAGFMIIEGGVSNEITGCYAEGNNSSGAFFWFAGVVYNLLIRNFFASGHDTPFARLHSTPFGNGVAYGLNIQDCYLACDWILGSENILGIHYAVNNFLGGQLSSRGYLYDSTPYMTAGWIANYGGSAGFAQGTNPNPQADHSWKLKTFGRPMHEDVIGVARFRAYQVDSLTATRNQEYTRSADTGFLFGSDAKRENGATTQNGPDLVLGSISIPDRTHGLVTVVIKAIAAADESKGGTWRYHQRIYRPSGGDLTLLGSVTKEVADKDAGFSDPDLAVDLGTESVQVLCHARTDGAAHYAVVLEVEAIRP